MTEDLPLCNDAFARLMDPFAVPDGASVAVAVSGGADSMALALLLDNWAKKRGVRVTGLTVDHRLRAEAAKEARQVGAWLAKRGVAHEILAWERGGAVKTAVQARARQARYALMGDWCRAHGVAHLFVAHHQGDQAETFLMRLKRGATLHGLAGMAPARDLGGVALCRPLLPIPKARLMATLHQAGQDWVEDPSNTNARFERVRVRALIDALAPDGVTAARLAGAAQGAARVSAIIEHATQAFGERFVNWDGRAATVDAAALADLPAPVAERVLARWVQAVGARAYPPAPEKLSRLRRWAVEEAAQSTPARSLGGCVLRAGPGGWLSISPEPPRRGRGNRRNAADAKRAFFATRALPPGVKSLTSEANSG